MGKCKNWTQEEKDFLCDNYGNVSIETIARKLNRSVSGVVNMKVRLKLGTFLDNGEYVTFNSLLNILGCGSGNYKMTSWVENLNFPIRKKRVINNSFWVVKIDEFWKWAEKNQEILDFSRLEENALPPEPQWAKEKRKKDYLYFQKYKTNKWTKCEDGRLKRLLKYNKYSYAELSEMFGRTCGAIQRRIKDLNIDNKPIKAKVKFWSEDEIQVISDMIKAGHRYEEISETTNRSTKAIRGKMYNIYGTENLSKIRAMLK